MRVLRASRSPSAIRCRQSRSSAAVSGLGKDPAFPSSRRENSRLWAKSSSAAEIMYIAPFPPPYELRGRPYAPVCPSMSPFSSHFPVFFFLACKSFSKRGILP